MTNRLVVAHMTKSEMHYLDWGLLGPLLLFLNQYFNNFLPERIVLWFALAWGAFDMVRYCIQVRTNRIFTIGSVTNDYLLLGLFGDL